MQLYMIAILNKNWFPHWMDSVISCVVRIRFAAILTTIFFCLYYRKQQLKRCYDKQLVHITVILRSKNMLSSLESFQTLQLLNTHLVNFKFVFRNYFFTVFAIYFVDRKYKFNSWIDIGINFDIFRIYIFNVEFSYLII
jgi:hypothetical protein